MADETMFARLERALYQAMVDDGGIFLGDYLGPNNETIVDGFVPLGDLVRALLAELRKACDENGMNVIGSPSDFLDTIDAILAEAGGSGGA